MYERESLIVIVTFFPVPYFFFIFSDQVLVCQGGDEEKYKLATEAHTVLSNPPRREHYGLGEDLDGMNGGGGGFSGMNPADMEEILC